MVWRNLFCLFIIFTESSRSAVDEYLGADTLEIRTFVTVTHQHLSLLNIYEDIINDGPACARTESCFTEGCQWHTCIAVSRLLFMYWMLLSTCWGDSLPAGLCLWISPFFFFHAPLTSLSLSACRGNININSINQYWTLLWSHYLWLRSTQAGVPLWILGLYTVCPYSIKTCFYRCFRGKNVEIKKLN